MVGPTETTLRVTYPGKRGIGLFVFVLIAFGSVAVLLLRLVWTGLYVRDGWPLSLVFAVLACGFVFVIVNIGWRAVGPSLILTPGCNIETWRVSDTAYAYRAGYSCDPLGSAVSHDGIRSRGGSYSARRNNRDINAFDAGTHRQARVDCRLAARKCSC